MSQRKWSLLPLLFVLAFFTALAGCSTRGDELFPGKDFATVDGCTCLSTATSSASTVSSVYQIEVQGYSSVNITMTSCVNGECETYHFESEEAF